MEKLNFKKLIKNENVLAALILTLLCVIFSIVVKTVDVGIGGLSEQKIGLIHINMNFYSKHVFMNYNAYNISAIIGYFSIALVLVFASLGLLQLIKRRSLIKVDRNILVLGGLFVITMLMYVFFNKFPINMRPFVMPNESKLEASFPSSHTVLVIVVCGAISLILNEYVKNKLMCNLIRGGLIMLIVMMIYFRTISGVHWFSDIIAGVLFGFTLLAWFNVFRIKNSSNVISDEEIVVNDKAVLLNKEAIGNTSVSDERKESVFNENK